MAGEVEVAPDHATAQWLSELRERSLRVRTSPRSRGALSLWGLAQGGTRGSDMKQFSILTTNLSLNSNSIAEASSSHYGIAGREIDSAWQYVPRPSRNCCNLSRSHDKMRHTPAGTVTTKMGITSLNHIFNKILLLFTTFLIKYYISPPPYYFLIKYYISPPLY